MIFFDWKMESHGKMGIEETEGCKGQGSGRGDEVFWAG